MRNPVWIGPEAGIRCSADQCSKTWLFLRDHLQSRTSVSRLPRPDPVHKVAPCLSHLWRAVLDFNFRRGWFGCEECVYSPSFLSRSSALPWEVHVPDQLHVHLHHLPHPSPLRRAHAGHAKVRGLSSGAGGSGAGWGRAFLTRPQGVMMESSGSFEGQLQARCGATRL